MDMPKTVARLLFYRFLARCYAYPAPEFGQELRQAELWPQLQAAGEALGHAVHGKVGDLQDVIDVASRQADASLLDLQIEYTYLFVNAIPHLPAPPYESAYSSEGLLMGKAVSEVLQAYREAGLVMGEEWGLMPDHLSTELEFMAYLVGQEAAAMRQAPAEAEIWRARQRGFLARHLLRWGPAFLARVTEHARRPFYARLADLTAALFRFEEQGSRLPRSVARRNL